MYGILKIPTLILLILWLTACYNQGPADRCNGQVVINDFVASNASIFADDDGDFEDWIKLYNCTDSAVDLSGWGLSDNLNRPFKWVFENTQIQPNEYLIIWASSKDRQQPGLPLHTNFKISASGEPLLLTRPGGETVDQIDAIVVPTDKSYGRYPDGTASLYYFDQPTPGQQNLQPTAQEILSPPVFSKTSGFYEQAINLTISHPDPNVTIYYTLDGSIPDPKNLKGSTYRYKNQYPQNPGNHFGEFLEASYQTHKYSRPLQIQNRTNEPDRLSQISTSYDLNPTYFPAKEPEFGLRQWNKVLHQTNRAINFTNRVLWFGFRGVRKLTGIELPFIAKHTFSHFKLTHVPDSVFKGTNIRAIAVKDNAYPSEVVTHNYFIATRNTFSLPIVAITVPEKGLFDFDNGIMVAGRRFEEWREANPADDAGGGSPANWRHRGQDIASHLQLYSDDLVIDQQIGIRPHGGNSRATPHKSLRLYARSGYGQNSFDHAIFADQSYESYKRLILRNSGNDYGHTFFRDATIQCIMGNLSFSTQSYQPAVVFINAEYRGILNFRERYDKHYFARRYGAEEERIDLLTNRLTNRARVKLGDNNHWNRLIELLEKQDVTLQDVYHQVNQKVDIHNFIDYQIANIFAQNHDWPQNNIDYWRYRTEVVTDEFYPKDGRWRWLMFDTDFGFGFAGNTADTLLSSNSLRDNATWSTFLLRTLLENEQFKHQFITRFADLLNSDFQSQRMVNIIHKMQAILEPEMPRHIHRWNRPASIDSWHSNIKVMTDFAEQRPTYQRQHILDFFGLEGEYKVELNVSDASHGQIRINSLTINEQSEGVEGEPYPWRGQYFKGVPIELEAIAQPGYRFSHWSGVDSDSSIVTIDTEHDLKIMAYFFADVNAG